MQSYLSKMSYAAAVLAVLSTAGCKKSEADAMDESAPSALQNGKLGQVEQELDETITIAASTLSVFQPPLPEVFESEENPLTEAKINLGRQLYYDSRLSKNHDVSCNTCHLLDEYGVDGKKTSVGHKSQTGVRNSPSVYNAAGHFAQFWDGRSPDVEEQAMGPILNPVEMAYKGEAEVRKLVASIPEYVREFKEAFPDDKQPVTLANIGRAIAAFERKLSTPAPWDAFLAGEESALSEAQKKGFFVFVSTGCPSCHMGTYVGGTTFQKVGAVKPWPNQEDKGRLDLTHQEADEMMFKTPSLRNVAKTAPYFHDGSVADLRTAIKMMAKYQLGRQLSDSDTSAIASWLDSLTGELPMEYIQRPELPVSHKMTPKPDPN